MKIEIFLLVFCHDLVLKEKLEIFHGKSALLLHVVFFCHFFRNIMDTSCNTEPLPKLEAGACVEAENVARQRRERARSAREKIENVTPLWLRSEKKQIDGEIMSLYGGNSAHDRRRFLP